MTDNEAILIMDGRTREEHLYMYDASDRPYLIARAENMALNSLKEIQAYRAIGTVEEIQKTLNDQANMIARQHVMLKQYREIGTVEEFIALKEKHMEKKPIRHDLCTCPSCGTHNEIIKKRRNTVAFDTVYCWHCGQAMDISK